MTSIIINTFNRKKALLMTIESIINQTRCDYEIIVIDDGSTDGTEKALNNAFAHFSIHYLWQPNAGVSRARNRGIQLSKGELITILDSDIICVSNWLDQITSILYSDESIDILGTCPYPLWLLPHKQQMADLGPPMGRSLIDVSAVGGGIMTTRRQIFTDVGFFDESIKFSGEDVDFCWRAILAGKRIVYNYAPLTFHAKDRTRKSRLSRVEWVYESTKNRLYVQMKTMPVLFIVRFLPKELVSALRLLLQRITYFRPLWRAVKWIVLNRRSITQQRHQLYSACAYEPIKLSRLYLFERRIDEVNKKYFKYIKSSNMRCDQKSIERKY